MKEHISLGIGTPASRSDRDRVRPCARGSVPGERLSGLPEPVGRFLGGTGRIGRGRRQERRNDLAARTAHVAVFDHLVPAGRSQDFHAVTRHRLCSRHAFPHHTRLQLFHDLTCQRAHHYIERPLSQIPDGIYHTRWYLARKAFSWIWAAHRFSGLPLEPSKEPSDQPLHVATLPLEPHLLRHSDTSALGMSGWRDAMTTTQPGESSATGVVDLLRQFAIPSGTVQMRAGRHPLRRIARGGRRGVRPFPRYAGWTRPRSGGT